MLQTKKHTFLFILLTIVLVVLFFTNISLGSVSIPVKEIVNSFLGNTMQKDSWEIILWNFRLPKAFTAILVGMALSISGLLMQTLFRNPLAGPYVLGLSSGASLGVAFVILGAGFLPSFLATIFLSIFLILDDIMVSLISEDYGNLIMLFFLIFTLVPAAIGLVSMALNSILKRLMHGVK